MANCSPPITPADRAFFGERLSEMSYGEFLYLVKVVQLSMPGLQDYSTLEIDDLPTNVQHIVLMHLERPLGARPTRKANEGRAEEEHLEEQKDEEKAEEEDDDDEDDEDYEEEDDDDEDGEDDEEEDQDDDEEDDDAEEEPQPKKRKAEESVAATAKKTKTDTNGESGEGE